MCILLPWVPCGRRASGECMGAGRLVRPLSILVAGARELAWTHRPLCYMEKLYLNSSCLFSWVLERSFPVAWDVRGCLPFFPPFSFCGMGACLAIVQRPEPWAQPEAG